MNGKSDSLTVEERSRVKVPRDIAQQIRGVALRMRKSQAVVSLDRPARHADVIAALYEWADKRIAHDDFEQGFLTMSGKYIDRRDAARLCGREGQLFSEDLW